MNHTETFRKQNENNISTTSSKLGLNIYCYAMILTIPGMSAMRRQQLWAQKCLQSTISENIRLGQLYFFINHQTRKGSQDVE